uniref:Uncharacterized protein n=1 Tax=Anguilla anguilla TaxID=7936 RepID=A0A0E9PIE6_ANGAN
MIYGLKKHSSSDSRPGAHWKIIRDYSCMTSCLGVTQENIQCLLRSNPGASPRAASPCYGEPYGSQGIH